MNNQESKLHRHYNTKYTRHIIGNEILYVKVQYDDTCRNGHNTLSITGNVEPLRGRGGNRGGCIRDEIVAARPDLEPYIKWHLCSTDGPLHYVANTVYLVERGQLDSARMTAIWPEASDEDLKREGLEDRLKARLPALLEDFKKAVESLGFEY